MAQLSERAHHRRVLAIGAHPDDVEIGAGGLLARLAQSGARVVVAVVSTPGQAEVRMAEAREGARLLGAELMLCSGGRPGRVEDLPMHQLVARLDEAVAAVRPELVLTHSLHDVHRDHRLVHEATLATLRRTTSDLFCFSSTSELHSGASFLGPCFADIGETIETKLAALAAHASQVARGGVDPEYYRDLARAQGRLCGARYAESFEVLRLRL